jgi:regulator of protease activity HflC (stomatin/prohibitin superfamily)
MKRTFYAGIIIAALLTVGCTRVGPGYVGVKINMAGDSKGVDSVPAVTGWAFYNPFLTSIYEYPTFVQQVVWTESAAEGRPANEEITFTTADQMKVAVDVSLAYHIKPEMVPAFYVKFRNDDLTAFTYGYLHSLARDHFNNTAGKYHIEQIMGDNGPFIADVKASLQKDLTPLGVELESQFGIIGAPRPPDAVIASINAKVQATQIAQQKQNELIQVDADMAKERSKTDTYARNTLTLAEAQATANRKLADSITPNLLDLKRLEKWNGVLPQVSGGSTPFINLTK